MKHSCSPIQPISDKFGFGKNHLVLGPMFASKSTHLEKVVQRTRLCPAVVTIVLVPTRDARWGGAGMLRTHSRSEMQADAVVGSGEEAIEAVRKICTGFADDKHPRKAVVVLDEAQMVDGVHTFAEWVLDHPDLPTYHIDAHFAALDGSSSRKMFASVVELLPLCDKIDKLNAVCMCCQKRAASFTRRDVEAQGEFFLGAEESYSAVCGRCHAHAKSQPCPFAA
jgi:thymidine kinase